MKNLTIGIKRDLRLAQYNVSQLEVKMEFSQEEFESEGIEELRDKVSEAVDSLIETEIEEFIERNEAIKQRLKGIK